jgi:peptide chain release factor 3
LAYDAAGTPAFLASMKAEIEVAQELWPKIVFHMLREHAGLAESETADLTG